MYQSNVNVNDLLELRFTVASNAENEDDEDRNFIFDIVRPFEKQSVCVRNKEKAQELDIPIVISAISNWKEFKYDEVRILNIENNNGQFFDYRVSFAQQRRDNEKNKLEEKFSYTVRDSDGNVIMDAAGKEKKAKGELKYKNNTYTGELKLAEYKLPTKTPEEEVTLHLTYHQDGKQPVTISRTFRIRECDPGTIGRISGSGNPNPERGGGQELE